MVRLQSACVRCRKGRRRCDQGSDGGPCSRCAKLNVSCIYDLHEPPAVVREPRSCIRCYKHHKKCVYTNINGSCDRCISLDVQCLKERSTNHVDLSTAECLSSQEISATSANASTMQSTDPGVGIAPKLPLALRTILTAFENSTATFEEQEVQLEDPDLIATFDDWLLVFNHLTEGPNDFPSSKNFDAEVMLRDYFHKPAVLRLILCCHAIRATPNEANCLEYYTRARKALIRADLLTPSTDLIISCQYIFLLARDYNQPALGQHFLQIAARMVKELALDIDPDDSPDSLVKLMIPREKEERRRIFWSFYEVLTSNTAVSPSYTKLDISGDSVKAPSQVLDPHSVFRSDNVVHHTANIFNLIASIKQAWAATPLSISDVFNMITDSCLRDQFDTVITSIPQQYLLLSETLFSDINIEGPRYLQQIKTSNTYVTELNLIYHSSISVFHRPVMFLSALASCHPSKLNPRDREVLATAINKCIESALRILSIFDFICFTLYTAGIDVLPPEDRWMHRVYTDAYPLFEAVVCLWFASCRMDPAWYTLTHFSTEFNSPKLRQRLEWLVGAYPALEVGAVTPIFKAMSLILLDLQHVAEVGRDYVFNTSIVDGVEALTLGMRVMAVGVTQEDESAPVIDPYCYLGLLGMEIGKNIRWRGQTEDSWRLFWKLKA